MIRSISSSFSPILGGIVGFRTKLSEKLGEGVGDGIVWSFSKSFLLVFAIIASTFETFRPRAWKAPSGADFFKHNTWRIAALSVVLGFFLSPGMVRFSAVSPDEAKGIYALVQLSSGRKPAFPSRNFFEPTKLGEEDNFFGEGFTYYRYKENEVRTRKQLSNDCFLVPAGEKLTFSTLEPPSDVKNMELDVQVGVGPTMQPITLWEKVTWMFGRPKSTFRNWRYIHDHWSTVDSVNYTLVATALPARRIPYPHSGGMVCF